MNKKENKLFVNEQIALLLRRKGFNEPCLAKHTKWAEKDKTELYPESQNFHKGPHFQTCQNSNYPNGLDHGIIKVTAPLYQQVFDWLEEYHDKNIYAIKHGKGEEAHWIWWEGRSHSLGNFRSKYEALDEAIIYTLEGLNDKKIKN